MLTFTDGCLSGNIGGKPVFGRSAVPLRTSGLLAGEFDLMGPAHDLVFGAYIVAVLRPGSAGAAGGSDGASMNKFQGEGAAFPKMQPGDAQAIMKLQGGGAAYPKVQPGDAQAIMKFQGTGAAYPKLQAQGLSANHWKFSPTPVGYMVGKASPGGPAAASATRFVISDRLIPGFHCVVVSSGFADLVLALQSGREATLTVT